MRALRVLSVVLPDRVVERLVRRAEREARTVEELLAEIALKLVNADLPSKVEAHLVLCEKYLSEAEEFLKKGDAVQASEKGWGAASQVVKAIAAKEEVEIRSHRELHDYVSKLAGRIKDPEVRMLWKSAGFLHVNFYEDWFTIEDVRRFIEKLMALLQRIGSG